jgi:hypothetical protein
MLTNGAIRVFKSRSDGGEDEMARFTPRDTIGGGGGATLPGGRPMMPRQ